MLWVSFALIQVDDFKLPRLLGHGVYPLFIWLHGAQLDCIAVRSTILPLHHKSKWLLQKNIVWVFCPVDGNFDKPPIVCSTSNFAMRLHPEIESTLVIYLTGCLTTTCWPTHISFVLSHLFSYFVATKHAHLTQRLEISIVTIYSFVPDLRVRWQRSPVLQCLHSSISIQQPCSGHPAWHTVLG
jgi:hypothetical protein